MKLSKTLDLSSLMISISGVRGKLQSGFGLEEILLFAQGFAELYPRKTVVIGRDSRPSGPFIVKILEAALLSQDSHLLQLGVVPTPTVKAVVNLSKADAGVMVSASHNPMEWNAFKFIGKKGFFFSSEENSKLMSAIQKGAFALPVIHPKGEIRSGEKFIQEHIESVLAKVNIGKLKKRKFKVFLDAVNGAGSEVLPELLKRLGCKVYLHNTTLDGTFPRPPEPTPKALVTSFKAMKKTDAEIGFALDPDADRLVLLSPKLGPISEELTLPLALGNVLPNSKKNSKVVVNLSSSFVTDFVCQTFGAHVLRSKVGEANVVAEMIAEKAVFGGEGNGGVIDPSIPSFGRDTLSGIAHILNYLSETGYTLDKAISTLPQIFMEKQSFPLKRKDSLQSLYEALQNEFKNAQISDKDGLYLSWEGHWVHVRPSNTEPIFRVIVEAKNQKDLEATLARVKKCAES